MDAGAPPPKDLNLVARACGAFAIALGVVILVGWLVGASLLTKLAPSLPAATPNSAFMFVACGVALIAETSARNRAIAWACALFVVGLASATLLEHATGRQLGVDNPLGFDIRGLEHPGRPATHTAGAFLLVGCCLLVARWRTRVGDLVAGTFCAGAAGVVGLAVAGYLIGVEYLYGRGAVHGMSLHTALGLVVLVVGVLALRPHAPPASWYARTGPGEAAARRLMGPALVLPFLAGGLVQAGASLGLWGGRFGITLLMVLFAAAIQGLIYLAVHVVRGHEAVREALERDRREEAQRFTTLASRAPVGIFETDPAGNVVYVNDRWQEITGLSASEFIGGGRIVHPDERERLRAEWATAAAEGRDFRREFRLLRPDGEVRWVSAHATALRNEDGELTGFIGSALDITGRRSAEERTEAIVSRIAVAVTVVGSDGTVLHANDASQQIIDMLAFEAGAVGEHAWGAVDTDGVPVSNEELPAEITRTTGREIDDRVLGFPVPDGALLWLRISTRRLSEVGPPYTVVTSYADITGQREDAARLAEAQRRFELAFDHAPIGVALVSLGGRLRRVNRALCEMFGFEEEELLASTFQGLTEDFDDDLEQFQRMLAGEVGSYDMEKRYTHKDGSLVWALVSVSLVRGDDGEPRYFIAQILDITQRRRLERELRHLAEHDNLTGLINRRAFGVALQRELTRERRYGDEWALLMIDLDGFKEVNDTHGHAAGDLVLRAVAGTIAERVRDTDVAARLGGDEFAVLLPSTGRAGAEVLAIDLVQALRELSVDVERGEQASITASVGLACSAELPDDRDEDTVLVAADLAMYQAKRAGRDGYVVHGG